MPEWGSHLALEALPACIGAPTGGQCGTATKTLRSRQCDRDEPRGGASGNIDDRSVRAFAVKPRAFGNAAMRRWLTARRGQADLVLAADHRVMADTNPTTVPAAIAPANTRISPPAACAVQYSTRPRVQHRAISRCHDGASGRRQRLKRSLRRSTRSHWRRSLNSLSTRRRAGRAAAAWSKYARYTASARAARMSSAVLIG